MDIVAKVYTCSNAKFADNALEPAQEPLTGDNKSTGVIIDWVCVCVLVSVAVCVSVCVCMCMFVCEPNIFVNGNCGLAVAAK